MKSAKVHCVSRITPNPDNLFFLWDGDSPDRDRLAQINLCLKLASHQLPSAVIYLFSNVIEPDEIASENIILIRWSVLELCATSPLQGRAPLPANDWSIWSDLFRVICLWRWGGSYFDLDDLLIRPLPFSSNAIAACFLTPEREREWLPAPVIRGNYATSTGRLESSATFRFGADPMLNFCAKHPFLEEWLRRIPTTKREEWGQILPTTLFASDPVRWKRTLNAIPWCDLLYHGYDGGHHPGDQRYSGPRLVSDQVVTHGEFERTWITLTGSYAYPLVKNHEWKCQHVRGDQQSRLDWAVQKIWSSINGSALSIGQRFSKYSGSYGKTHSHGRHNSEPRKLILKCTLPPGDIVALTASVRDLHRSNPGQFITDVWTPSPELWAFNPNITPISDDDPDKEIIDCLCPLIMRANRYPRHCIEGFMDYLNLKLNLGIQLTDLKGDIHLHPAETSMPSPVEEVLGYTGPYWLIASGGKRDYSVKWWDARRYQRVVDHFRGRVQFVQVGASGDFHPELEGTLDLRGRTNLRQLVRLVHFSEGVVCPVTLLMHLAAAVPSSGNRGVRPCVVIAGGREPVNWEAYPGHQFLHTIGMLPCCETGGCWKARALPIRDGSRLNDEQTLCIDVVQSLPRCMDLITAEVVIARIESFIEGSQHFPKASSDRASQNQLENRGTGPAILEAAGRVDPSDLLVRHYSKLRTMPKQPLREDLSSRVLTNNPLGLGDTVVITQLPAVAYGQGKTRLIHSDSPHFAPLVKFHRHYTPAPNRPRISADFLNARYDLGNGHFTQRLQRAFGLRPADRPQGHIACDQLLVPRRVGLHFDPGIHSLWQKNHVHPRARELYPESRKIIAEFARNHPNWSFVQFGGRRTDIDGVEDAVGLPLEQTILKLATCEYFIGIVSGPMHVATALGVKCIVILNFPKAAEIMLPTLKRTGCIESEWLYPQNVHLHQDDEAPLVRRFSLKNLERAVQGELYPFWTDRYLPLIWERIPEP